MTNRINWLFRFFFSCIFAQLLIYTGIYSRALDVKWSEPANLRMLNSEEDDFGPVWNRIEGLLYFNSEVSGYSMFYTSSLIDSADFSEPVFLPGDLNKKGNNQSYITFTPDNVAYFSSFRKTSSRSYLNIFQSYYQRKAWSEPFPVDSLMYDSFTSHPSVSPDGSIMVFSTDRGSKTGETDLWIAYMQPDGTWSGLASISELNSQGNEITPFLASNDSLYFASDGLGGPGGFDMFLSVRSEGVWQRPFPISDLNTKYDESDFALLPGNYAVFASNRPSGKGKLDLYIARYYPEDLQKNIYASDLELSIAVQIQSVRTTSETYYRNLPLVPFIFKGTNLPDLLKSSGKIYPNVDSVLFSTLHILGNRLRQYNSSLLYISAYLPSADTSAAIDSASLLTAGEIKNYLMEKESIPTNRIIITTETMPDNPETGIFGMPLIRFDSDEPAVFEPIQVGNKSVVIDPSGLEIFINARPQALLKNWVFGLRNAEGSLDTLKSGTNLPEQFLIDLKPYGKIFAESDSIVLNLVCTDTSGNKASRDILINVAHSEVKSSELVKSGDKTFEEYLFFVADGNTLSRGNLYTKLIRKIAESAEFTNGLTVRYYDHNPSTEKNAELLAEELKKKINNNYVKIETAHSDYSEKESFGKNLAPYMLSVLVEK